MIGLSPQIFGLSCLLVLIGSIPYEVHARVDCSKQINAVKEDVIKTWPNATVNFFFDPMRLSKKTNGLIWENLRVLEQVSCVKFKETHDSYPGPLMSITMRDDGIDTLPAVGYNERGNEIILIDDESPDFTDEHVRSDTMKQMVINLGVMPQIMRMDRDKYVKIKPQYIKLQYTCHVLSKSKYMEEYYKKLPFDYRSIANPLNHHFSTTSSLSIAAVDPGYTRYFYGEQMLTFMDIRILNKIYNCAGSETPEKKCDDQCPFPGFFDKQCNCMVPAKDGSAQVHTNCTKVTPIEPGTKKCVNLFDSSYCDDSAKQGYCYHGLFAQLCSARCYYCAHGPMPNCKCKDKRKDCTLNDCKDQTKKLECRVTCRQCYQGKCEDSSECPVEEARGNDCGGRRAILYQKECNYTCGRCDWYKGRAILD